jgi:hypothetical protein
MELLMGALKSKTMWFSAVLAVLAAFEMQQGLVRQLVGEQNFGGVMLGISVATAILRVVTTTSLTDK